MHTRQGDLAIRAKHSLKGHFMSILTPLEQLYEAGAGAAVPPAPFPADLAAFYGPLWLPSQPGRPYVAGNFVSTLDGVVSLQLPGKTGGGPISGNNRHDHAVMGILRAVADAIVVGAGTLRDTPNHRWTAARIFPAFAASYAQLRANLGKPEPPLTVIVSARGDVPLQHSAFQSGDTPVLIVTTDQGAQRIHEQAQPVPAWVQVVVAPETGIETGTGAIDPISARAILQVVNSARHCDVVLTEGGPHLLGNFLAEQLLDELFLTLAPQIAGRVQRDGAAERPGLAMGQLFAPQHPLWGELVSIRRAENLVFLRYTFATGK